MNGLLNRAAVRRFCHDHERNISGAALDVIEGDLRRKLERASESTAWKSTIKAAALLLRVPATGPR